jgi:hypothetical protein
MDSIIEMLDKLGELTPEQLDELENSILSEFDSLEKAELSRDSVDNLTKLADAADALRAERTRRDQEAAELSAAREQAVSRVRGADETAEDAEAEPETVDSEDEEPVEDEEVEDEKVAASTDAPAEASLATQDPSQPDLEVGKPDEEIPEQITGEPVQKHEDSHNHVEDDVNTEAAAPAAEDASTDQEDTEGNSEEETVTAAAGRESSALEAPADRQPVARTVAPVTITAGADIPGITAGAELPNMRAVADALIKRRQAMGRTSGGDGEQHTIATVVASFPEGRVLTSNDTQGNAKKIEDVVSPAAVTAAGGLCAPVTVSYDIFGLEGSTARPVRDALPVFNADRGGIRFVTPPVLADLNGSVSVWTLQDDIDAATAGAPDPVKPCLRVDCGDEVTVYTEAIPLCLTFGNLGSRAWPELVERHMELAMIWHARFAEQRLITRIGALSKSVSAAAQLGAARDFFVTLEQAAAAYRNRHRMDSAAPLRVILPEWFRNALRADLVKQLPGDGQENTFGLADNFMMGWFALRGINVSWHMDGESGQLFTDQVAGAAVQGFPSTLVWYLFAEGTFLFLDGGTLDLGLVRDSILNGTNDYKVFLETFEGVAKVGVESLRVSQQLKIAGAAAATVATV